MKITNKFILLALLAIASHTILAGDIEMEDILPAHTNEVKEPQLQLTLFPGIARAPKKTSAMHMLEQPSDSSNILNLRSSLNEQEQPNVTNQGLNDIEVISNNILEIRF